MLECELVQADMKSSGLPCACRYLSAVCASLSELPHMALLGSPMAPTALREWAQATGIDGFEVSKCSAQPAGAPAANSTAPNDRNGADGTL